jgi:integrase
MKILSAKAVEAILRGKKPGRHAVGPQGLYLQITGAAGRSWIYRYQRDGKQRHMGLGSAGLDGLTLEEAREEASKQRHLHRRRVDPLASRNAADLAGKIETARGTTFRECADRYIEAHKASWKNPIHRKQWSSTLEAYVYPVFGDLPVSEIDTVLVLKAVEPIWSTKSETASRVRGRIESILNWARARNYREGDNPARWRGHLDKLLPDKASVAPVKHHAALPYGELHTLMSELRKRHSVSARALEFTILTAGRTNETIGALWTEFNLQDRLWTIPKERMKGRRGSRKSDHVVPLSEPALALLAVQPTDGPFVFAGGKAGRGLSNAAMDQLLKGMGYGPDRATVHGFRSTFKDWCSDQTDYPNEMSEMALSHTVSDKVEAAYRRGNMLEKRRRLMADWAAFCAGSRHSATVLPMSGGSHGQ